MGLYDCQFPVSNKTACDITKFYIPNYFRRVVANLRSLLCVSRLLYGLLVFDLSLSSHEALTVNQLATAFLVW